MKRLLPLTLALVAGLSAGVAAQATPTGIRGDMIKQLDDAATKLVQLAQAIPQEKYSWSPGQGVRSVSQVLMHVAGGNYDVGRFVGVQTASPLPPDAENSVTEKAQVVTHLRNSVENLRRVIRGLSDADLDKPTNMYGQKTTYRNALLSAVSHCHEHAGQVIAYARVNGITPPWSAASN